LTGKDLFIKGNPNIRNLGPKKGSKRIHVPKKSLVARWELERRGINLIDSILDEISKMRSPESRASALIKLLPYVYPTLTAIKLEMNKEDDAKLVPSIDGNDLLNKVKLILERKDIENGITTEKGQANRRLETVDIETGRDSDSKGHGSESGSADKK
jgi:hypothetical protein